MINALASVINFFFDKEYKIALLQAYFAFTFYLVISKKQDRI